MRQPKARQTHAQYVLVWLANKFVQTRGKDKQTDAPRNLTGRASELAPTHGEVDLRRLRSPRRRTSLCVAATLVAKLIVAPGCLLGIAATSILAQQAPDNFAKPGTAKVADAMRLPSPKDVHLGGLLGERVSRNEKNRLLNVDEQELLAGFRHRPGKQAWIGEHVGKFLHAASLAYANTGDPQLRTKLDRVVRELLKTQEPDGYLGTYVHEKRWGLFPDADWDVWVHKYDLLGLLAYYQYTGNKEALQAAKPVGDLLVSTFGPGKKSIISAGTHVGMASTSVLEPMVLLYRATAEPKYLEFAKYLVASWEEPNGPHILSSLLKTRSVRKTANAKAYEMLSNLNGLCELYRATGEKEYLDAVLFAWEDIVKNRLYITGSGSSFEHWQDEGHFPGGTGANICETCVTVTWEQLNIQLLRLLGEARFADQLERSVYNHLLAAQKPSGDDWCYYTPLEGKKPYDAGTNCCHSSGPRGVALLPTFAYATFADGIAVNLYSSSEAAVRLNSGRTIGISQKTDYPIGRAVSFTINPHGQQEFTLYLRSLMPSLLGDLSLGGHHPFGDTITVNGMEAAHTQKGRYLALHRTWKDGDVVRCESFLGQSIHPGQAESEGRTALMFGPLVLALDEELNPALKPIQRATLASDKPDSLDIRLVKADTEAGAPVFEVPGLFRAPGESGPRKVTLRLTPYYAAGVSGSRFEVWIRQPGPAGKTGSSLFYLSEESRSREGNQGGEITDDDPSTFRVTFDGTKKDLDWYAVTLPSPVTINRVAFAHGHSFHDGGWFDTSAGKPHIQVQKSKGGAWEDVGSLDSYPDSTTAKPGRSLRDGATFSVKFPAVSVYGVRISGKPASGDNPNQAFSSCAELQGFFDK